MCYNFLTVLSNWRVKKNMVLWYLCLNTAGKPISSSFLQNPRMPGNIVSHSKRHQSFSVQACLYFHKLT